MTIHATSVKRHTASTLAACLLLAPLPSLADFPEKPLNLTVAYSAGGATDFQARIVTSKGDEYLGQPITVINRPGAGGQIGWNQFVSTGATDGYDIAAYNVPHFIAQSIMYDTDYSIENLQPIANWGADPAVLIVGKDSEFDSIDDVVEYAKANPGKLTVSGAGLYVGHHIAALQLQQSAEVTLKYLPTSGGVDALRFVVGGQVMAGFNNLSDAFRNQDRIKILGIADLERSEAFLPEVPTFIEAGYDVDDTSLNLRGIMVPRGVDAATVDYLSSNFIDMFQDEGIAEQMKEGGSTLRVMEASDLEALWKQQEAYLTELFAQLETP
ncbi:tripartite tricarboxylate transporter substrate binding protein [Halomonas litopenaei]|uniref:tripartite tricarboxylate transporter substrate binding protein n=1 Tax=Halomonas litopenaei TaxID=2109328 RepID=UPI003FA0D8E7